MLRHGSLCVILNLRHRDCRIPAAPAELTSNIPITQPKPFSTRLPAQPRETGGLPTSPLVSDITNEDKEILRPLESSVTMMHYDSWLHQQILDNQQYYPPRYMEEVANFRHRNESESEQTGDEMHDTITSATSGERSSSADLFRLEFAASQWSKLVSNAEGLFNKLITNNILPHNDQDQIEEWLCLKQEYEECIASDDTGSLQNFLENPRRSLEIIEEVTETDEKTDESGNRKYRKNSTSTASEMSEEDDEEEENSSENPDFLEKLDEFMKKLKIQTDLTIDSKKYEFDKNMTIISPNLTANNNNDYVPIIKPIPIRNPNSRRNSMLPGSEMCNEVIAFNFRPQNRNFPQNGENRNFDIFENSENRESDFRSVNCNRTKKDSPDLLVDLKKTEIPIKTLKTLAINNEVKQSEVKKIQSDLDIAHKRIAELQSTIRTKERFIEDMIKNSEVRTGAKQKFQRKRNKLEEEYYNARTQLAQAENSSYKNSDEKTSQKREIEMYKNMAINYEKRLMDIEMIKQIAGDSAKKVFELESSLNSSKKQMEKLKKALKKEEERKLKLEHELADDQKKIRELESKYNLTASKLREIQSESDDERNKPKIDDESRVLPKNDEKKNLLEVSARISHLDQVLKEKSMNLERMTDTDEKEALRYEIHNLRRTREALIEEKCGLDKKLQTERKLSTWEERKLLECGETIEAIDAMIEHKNEIICGRKDHEMNKIQREKSESMLCQLEKLSDGEMRTLFDKYFWKVIDLKQSSKNLEIQNAVLESSVEMAEKRIKSLGNVIEATRMEAERKIVEIQRQQQERLHLIFRHIAEETGSSGHEKLDRNVELAKYKRENKSLRRRLADVEALIKKSGRQTTSPPRILQKEMKSSIPMTRVTRERNKLIIQQTMEDKRKK